MVTVNENLMGTVSVSYLPAIQAAKQFSVSLEQLNTQLMNHQRLARQTGVVTAAGLAGQFNNQGIILDRYGRTLVDVNKKTETLTQTAAKQSKTVKDLANSHGFLAHRLGWFVSGTFFYGAINAAGQAVEAIKEVEMGMVEIARVTEDATADFDKMRTELLQLGIDYGRSWEEVQDIALRWAQAGYNVKEVLELTRSSLLALNTAELDIKNSTESLVGIMSQWGLQSKDLIGIIDKINLTADDYTVTSQDLVDGLLRSSEAAKNMGLSLEQTISLLTVMREASGRTGREVGNALRSILVFTQRDKTINVLERLGISSFTDSLKTQFRPAWDIFADVAAKWNSSAVEIQEGFIEAANDAGLLNEELTSLVGMGETWNDVQKRDAAEGMAGNYRRNYIISLITKLAKAQEVLNNMTDAAGYSMRENERTMEALEMKVQALKTAFTMLAVEIGEAGLLDVLKGAVDSTRELIEGFEQLDPAVRKLLIWMGEAVALMGVANITAKTFFSVDLLKGLYNYINGIQKAEVATQGLLAAQTGLLASFRALPVAGQIALVGFLSMAIYNLARSTVDTTEETDKLIQRSTNAAQKAKAQADEIKNLVEEYTDLKDKAGKSNEEIERFNKASDRLLELMPQIAPTFDEAGNAVINYGDLVKYSRIELEKLNKEMRDNIELAGKTAQSQILTLERDIAEQQEYLELLMAVYRGELSATSVQMAKYKDKIPGLAYRPEYLALSEEELLRLHTEGLEGLNELREKLKNAQKAVQLAEQLAASGLQPMWGMDMWGRETVSAPGVRGETPAQAYERLNAERERLNHQMKIGEISTEKYLASLKNIEQQMREAGVEERKIWSIQEEIASLQKKAGANLEDEADKLKKFYDEAYRDAMAYYQHETALARLSRDEQIQYLRDLSQAHEWEKEKMWSLEEQIFRLYREELKAMDETIEKSYRERIRQIDDERDAAIESIQAQIDALDALKESDDRLEAEREHNERIAELEKERRYHELRTGAEHEEAILEINKKIEEEKRSWQKQQEDWALEDRKIALRQQIETIRKNAEKEKKIWQETYDDIKMKWDSWSTEFAQSAINDPKWLEIGKKIGQQIANGFQGSISSMGNIISRAGGYTSSGGGGGSSGGGASSGGFSDGSVRVTLPDGTVTTGERVGNTIYYAGTPIREAFAGRDVQWNSSDDSVVIRHEGGIVGKPLAEHERLVRALEYEYVLSKKQMDLLDGILFPKVQGPSLDFQFKRLIAAIQTGMMPPTQTKRGDVIFKAPLFNAEKVQFGDRQDMEIMARELKRQVAKVR